MFEHTRIRRCRKAHPASWGLFSLIICKRTSSGDGWRYEYAKCSSHLRGRTRKQNSHHQSSKEWGNGITNRENILVFNWPVLLIIARCKNDTPTIYLIEQLKINPPCNCSHSLDNNGLQMFPGPKVDGCQLHVGLACNCVIYATDSEH